MSSSTTAPLRSREAIGSGAADVANVNRGLAGLSLRRGLFGLLAAWTLLFVASPGVLTKDGSALLACVGVGVFGAFATRGLEGRRWRTCAAEALAAGAGGAALMWWVWYVVPGALVYIGVGYGLYFALAGALLRGLARRIPLGIAVAFAWTATEVVRNAIPPPFGLGWLRLGHYAHDELWISGAARVFGIEGLTLLVAAFGGLVAEALVRAVRRASLVFAGSLLALSIVLARATGGFAIEDGPKLLLVQPAFLQEVKQFDPPVDNFTRVRDLTLGGIRTLRQTGEQVDLVCWGETMFQVQLFEPEVEQALQRGVKPPAWWGPLEAEDLAQWRRIEEELVRRRILAELSPGTSFLSGAEVLEVADEKLLRRNAIVLWKPDGSRSRAASKRFLVPGAETMLGLERYRAVRSVVDAIASYVPDFTAAKRTGVLELETRSGKSWRFGASVCFDNAFLEPYIEPLLREGIDFHLVASNEAWYHESCELDQMVAFSRLIALSTARSVVRATNSGVTLVIGPDGSETARLETGGRDRSVPGTLHCTIPVPSEPRIPFYARTRDLWRAGMVVACLGLYAARFLFGERRIG